MTIDLANSPTVVIITTLSALFGVSASMWGALVYLRKRFIRPMLEAIGNILQAADMVPSIKGQLFNNGGSSLKDSVDGIAYRLACVEAQGRALMQEHERAMFHSDAQGHTKWVNRTYCRLLGVNETDALGLGWRNSIHPDERVAYLGEWAEALRDRREFNRWTRHLSADGAELMFKVRAYPIDHDGRGYIGFLEPAESEPSFA